MDEISAFLTITDRAIWQEVFVTSLIIPVVIVVARGLRKWLSGVRPLSLLLKNCRAEEKRILIFLSQLSAVATGTNQINPNQKYVAFSPDPIPANRKNVRSWGYGNIDPVWSESDGRCVAEIFNTLGQAGKVKNIKVADTLNDWDLDLNPIFSVGFNPKTWSLEKECEPIFFDASRYFEEGIIKTKEGDKTISAFGDEDGGVLQKTFIKNTNTPVFILAGLGTQGTEAPGYFFSEHAKELGKLYGPSAFCIFLKTDRSLGSNNYEVLSMYPKVKLFRLLQYPVTYIKWRIKGVFK